MRIVYETDAAAKSSTEPSGNNYGIEEVYEAVYSFCETLISNPRVLEFKEIMKVLTDEAERLGVEVTQSQYKNLLRMVSNKFKELVFIISKTTCLFIHPP